MDGTTTTRLKNALGSTTNLTDTRIATTTMGIKTKAVLPCLVLAPLSLSSARQALPCLLCSPVPLSRSRKSKVQLHRTVGHIGPGTRRRDRPTLPTIHVRIQPTLVPRHHRPRPRRISPSDSAPTELRVYVCVHFVCANENGEGKEMERTKEYMGHEREVGKQARRRERHTTIVSMLPSCLDPT